MTTQIQLQSQPSTDRSHGGGSAISGSSSTSSPAKSASAHQGLRAAHSCTKADHDSPSLLIPSRHIQSPSSTRKMASSKEHSRSPDHDAMLDVAPHCRVVVEKEADMACTSSHVGNGQQESSQASSPLKRQWADSWQDENDWPAVGKTSPAVSASASADTQSSKRPTTRTRGIVRDPTLQIAPHKDLRSPRRRQSKQRRVEGSGQAHGEQKSEGCNECRFSSPLRNGASTIFPEVMSSTPQEAMIGIVWGPQAGLKCPGAPRRRNGRCGPSLSTLEGLRRVYRNLQFT